MCKTHIKIIFRICNEFENIKERALKVPETTEEMMESIAFIDKAKTIGIQKLYERIKVTILADLVFKWQIAC